MGNAIVTAACEMFRTAEPDDGLVARCRNGDVEALEEVYARWERPIFRHAYGMMRNADEADDVKQETFVRAFRAIGGFDGRCVLHSWLFGICANICRDRLKQKQRRPTVSLDVAALIACDDGPSGDPMRALMADSEHETILRAMAELPVAHRELLLLREVEGLSYEEIRDVLRCSLASVKLRLFRARQQWKKRYLALTAEGERQ